MHTRRFCSSKNPPLSLRAGRLLGPPAESWLACWGGFQPTGSECVPVSVFDDGDEKTLRRTSLCLKGERHFAESEVSPPPTHPTPARGPGSVDGFDISHRLWISCRSPTQSTLERPSLARRATVEDGAPPRPRECGQPTSCPRRHSATADFLSPRLQGRRGERVFVQR